MLRSKRKCMENGDGCLDVDSNGGRAGDIANTGYVVQSHQHNTGLELEQQAVSEQEGMTSNLSNMLESMEEGVEDEQSLLQDYCED